MYTQIVLVIIFLSSACVQCMNREAQIAKLKCDIEFAQGIINESNKTEDVPLSTVISDADKARGAFAYIESLLTDRKEITSTESQDLGLANPNSVFNTITDEKLKKIKQFITTFKKFSAAQSAKETRSIFTAWLEDCHTQLKELESTIEPSQDSTTQITK